MKGVALANGNEHTGVAVLLATGHSARDIFRLCKDRGVAIEAKPFALGVRIEHPQQIIDSIQYHCDEREPVPACLGLFACSSNDLPESRARGFLLLHVPGRIYCACSHLSWRTRGKWHESVS